MYHRNSRWVSLSISYHTNLALGKSSVISMYSLVSHMRPEKVIPSMHLACAFPLHQLVGCTGFDIQIAA
jgi:hypothetical protein